MINDDGNKIRKFREERHLSQQELAKMLGVGLSTLSMIECGQRGISYMLKDKFLEVFNYDIVKGVQNNTSEFTVNTSSIIPIPFYHVKAGANPKGEVMLNYSEKEALFFDKRWLKNILGVNPFNCSIITAKGDSMDSGKNEKNDIKNGDLLLVDNSNTEIINNKIFVVQIGNELLVKQVFQDFNGDVFLISANDKYETRQLTEEDNALIIGRVVWNGSNLHF